MAHLTICLTSIGVLVAGGFLYTDYFVYDRLFAAICAGLYKPIFACSIVGIIWILHQEYGGNSVFNNNANSQLIMPVHILQ